MSEVPELWWGTAHRKGRVLEADPEGGYWVHTLTDGNHLDRLPTDAVRLVPVAPVGAEPPSFPWGPAPFVEAVDALQAKVIGHCGDSESYIGTQGPEAVGEVCRELVVAAEKARDLMPEPFVTPMAPVGDVDRETLVRSAETEFRDRHPRARNVPTFALAVGVDVALAALRGGKGGDDA